MPQVCEFSWFSLILVISIFLFSFVLNSFFSFLTSPLHLNCSLCLYFVSLV